MKKFWCLWILILSVFFSCGGGVSAVVGKLIVLGNPILNVNCEEVKEFDAGLSELLDIMRGIMKNADGCGIAAPQVGVTLRAFLIETDDFYGEFINPVITFLSEETMDGPEGCLSIPGEQAVVKRAKKIEGYAFDRNGKKFLFSAEGDLKARAIQHEYDHLNGILFIHKLPLQNRLEILKRNLSAGF